MIKAIIFDFFDVIRTDGFQEWMKSHGFTRSDAPGDVSRRLDRGEIDERQFFEELAHIAGQTVDEVKIELETYEDDFNDELIEYIRSDINPKLKTAVLSNAASAYLRNILESRQLEPLFDTVVISSEIGAAKPDKEIFSYALEKLGVKAQDVVFVDDNPKYVEAAEKLGINGVVYKNFEQFKRDVEALL